MITKKDLLAQLAELATLSAGPGGSIGDPEGAHGDADDLLIEYINDPEIEAAYDAIQPKWYA